MDDSGVTPSAFPPPSRMEDVTEPFFSSCKKKEGGGTDSLRSFGFFFSLSPWEETGRAGSFPSRKESSQYQPPPWIGTPLAVLFSLLAIDKEGRSPLFPPPSPS